jgi:HPt (histidine-containing phosphotransfer) domain-containing protein
MAEDIVYIDREEGIKRVMNNVGLYNTLLAKFKAGTSLDELLGALDAGDNEKAQTSVHTIKGVAANLSLMELFKQTRELETQIKARSVDPAQIERVTFVFDETIKNIDKVLLQNE